MHDASPSGPLFPFAALLCASLAACATHTAPVQEDAGGAPSNSAPASTAPAIPAPALAEPSQPAPVAPATASVALDPVDAGAGAGAAAGPQDAEAAAPKVLDQQELEALTAEIRADIEAMRGQSFLRPVKVSVADREGFLAYARERQEQTTTPVRIRGEQGMAHLLGLIPAEMDLVATTMAILEEQVGGFYDPSTESFCLMSAFHGGVARVILAHELTHALDDQLYDIDGTLEELDGNSDAQLAFHSVVEGSGTALMGRWTRENLGEIDLEELKDIPGMESASMAEAPEYLWKPLLATYMRGASFLVKSDNPLSGQMRSPKTPDIERAFQEPPRSTEQVLHPEKYWREDQVDLPRSVRLDSGSLPAGWSVVSEDTLGELGLALFATEPAQRSGLDLGNPMGLLKVAYTRPAAEGWGGDRWILLENGSASFLLAASTWDSEADADEFLAAARVSGEAALANARSLAGSEFPERAGFEVERRDGAQVVIRVWTCATAEEAALVGRAIAITVGDP